MWVVVDDKTPPKQRKLAIFLVQVLTYYFQILKTKKYDAMTALFIKNTKVKLIFAK